MTAGAFRLLAALEGQLLHKVDRLAFAFHQADPKVPEAIEKAGKGQAREVFGHALVTRNGVDILPEIALPDARLPQEVGGFSLKNPVRENAAELGEKRIDLGIEGPIEFMEIMLPRVRRVASEGQRSTPSGGQTRSGAAFRDLSRASAVSPR